MKQSKVSESVGAALTGAVIQEKYIPSEIALKFIAFIRATGNEEFSSPEIHYKMADLLFSSDKKDKNVLEECCRGVGKLQTASSRILTPKGWTTMGNIQVGDEIITRSGLPAKVKWKTDPQRPKMYKMVLTDGTELKLGDEHLNIVERRTSTLDESTGKRKSFWKEQVMTTEELAGKTLITSRVRNSNKDPKQAYTTRVPLISNPVEFEGKDVDNDPYIFGLMLADGYFNKGILSLHEDDLEFTLQAVSDAGYKVNSYTRTSPKGYKINLGSTHWSPYRDWVFDDKHVPADYLYNSMEVRLAVLRGLMDGDGSLSSNGSSHYHTKNSQLADNVKELAQSLGGIAHVKTYNRTDKGDGETEYRVVLNMPVCPFRMGRKADSWKPTTKKYKQVVSITEYEESEEGYCIGVDSPCESYVTENYTVTHNSTIAEYAVIFAAALGEWPGFGLCPFIIFLGASAEGNVKQFFKNVASKITNSTFLSDLVTVKRVTDKEMELVNTEGVEMFVAGKGMNVNWRGARSPSGHRPSLLLADDILHNDSATSETIRKTIETNWFASALPALAPKHKIIYIGTPISEDDLLHKLKNSGSYSVVRFPLCDKFPVDEKDFGSVWPDRFTYDYALDMYKQFKSAGTTQLFYQEYMLEVTDLATLLVEEDDIQWFDPSVFTKNRSQYNYYISTDFATSTKKSADFSTIGVWAVSSNNDWLLVDGQCVRQSMQDNIDDLFRYVKKWQPLSVGIESSGQQGGFLSIIQEMMMKRNIWFTFAKKPGSKEVGIRPVKDKTHRFVTGVQPKFKQNKIWLPKPEVVAQKSPRLLTLVEELVHELGRFTLAGGVSALSHDDALDLLNQLSEMEIYAPASPEELMVTEVTEDGLVWNSVWDEDEDDDYMETNSNVF